MRHLMSLLCLTLFAGVVSSAPIPKALKKKTLSIEGRWTLVSMNYNNQSLNSGTTQIWAVTNDELVIEDAVNGLRRNNTVVYKLTPVEGDGENSVDWTIVYNNNANSHYTYRGRVKYNDDGFDFVFTANGRDSARPDTVEAGPNRYLYTFKKADK